MLYLVFNVVKLTAVSKDLVLGWYALSQLDSIIVDKEEE